MRVLLVSLGTRGDVEPFISIAVMLKKEGHNLACCFPNQFRALVQETGIVFFGLNNQFLELLETEDARITMGNKARFFRKIKAYFNLYKKSKRINKLIIKEQFQIIEDFKPDKVLYNIKAMYPLIWEVYNTNKTILVSPIPYLIHTVKEHSHIGFFKNYGSYLNDLTYRIANWVLIKNIIATAAPININYSQLKKALHYTRTIYTVSPNIIPPPKYWSKKIKTIGYPTRDHQDSWQENKELKQFLTENKKVLFVTFGSMINDDPLSKSAIILNILKKYEVPAIINTSSGGLIKVDGYQSSTIFFTENISYNWILPKVYAIIHHGGSGTTHLGLKHGCSTLIIPHILDQFMWNETISDLGLGPKGISINKISVKKLEPLILDLYQNNVYKLRAEQISKSIKKEDWTEKINELLNND